MPHHHHTANGPTSPWDALRGLREHIDDAISSALGAVPARTAMAWQPAVDITEKDGELLLTAELPGMKKEDIEIEVENNTLTLRGEKAQERETTEGERYLYERQFGSFTRSFTLPRAVDPDRIRARFQNGVITVVLPKTEESKGKRISIEGGDA